MRNHVKWVIVSLLAGVFPLLFSGCNKSSDPGAQEKQEIANYVAANNITATPNKDGLYYIPAKVGTGDSVTVNDWVLINYSGYYLETGYLFDSTDTLLAISDGIEPSYVLGGPIKGYISSSPSWLEGFLNMREGGYATFIIPSTLWNYDYQPRYLSVNLVKVIPNLRNYEISQITSFIDSVNTNHNTSFSIGDTVSGNGIYYFETQAGSGTSPTVESSVNLNYTGMLIDGRVFSKFSGQLNLASIYSSSPGFVRGIELMKPGSVGYIVIPYHEGYNSTTIYNDANADRVLLEPYSTLLYRIQLESVQ